MRMHVCVLAEHVCPWQAGGQSSHLPALAIAQSPPHPCRRPPRCTHIATPRRPELAARCLLFAPLLAPAGSAKPAVAQAPRRERSLDASGPNAMSPSHRAGYGSVALKILAEGAQGRAAGGGPESASCGQGRAGQGRRTVGVRPRPVGSADSSQVAPLPWLTTLCGHGTTQLCTYTYGVVQVATMLVTAASQPERLQRTALLPPPCCWQRYQGQGHGHAAGINNHKNLNPGGVPSTLSLLLTRCGRGCSNSEA